MIVVNTSSRFGERVIMEEEQVILSWEADSVHVLRKVFFYILSNYFIVALSLMKIFAAEKELRYESSTLILYKELSSPIFQSCQSVSEASVTPVQISTLCNI